MDAFGSYIQNCWQTPIINVFMINVIGYYTIGTTLKDKFSVVCVFLDEFHLLYLFR